jgi:hypothetical protein
MCELVSIVLAVALATVFVASAALACGAAFVLAALLPCATGALALPGPPGVERDPATPLPITWCVRVPQVDSAAPP